MCLKTCNYPSNKSVRDENSSLIHGQYGMYGDVKINITPDWHRVIYLSHIKYNNVHIFVDISRNYIRGRVEYTLILLDLRAFVR